MKLSSKAQEIHCGTQQAMQKYASSHPEYQQNRAAIESQIQAFIAQGKHKNIQQQIVIPVVVHVVYNTDEENIPDEYITSQIDALNADYGLTNSDQNQIPLPFQSAAVNCDISFCLAITDPNGNPSNGITRTFTDRIDFNTDDAMKNSTTGGINPWPSESYLNIWVCDLAQGFLGYTYQPGASSEIDGVVIDCKHFGVNGTFGGNYNKGRTTTHEVGHWINLYHPWGQGGSNPDCSDDDFVDDTPLSPGPNYNCANFPNNASAACNNLPYGDMFMNFMDYSYDNCLLLFTQGQKDRMVAAISTARSGLLSSGGCQVGIDSPLNNLTSLFPNPSNNQISITSQGGKAEIIDLKGIFQKSVNLNQGQTLITVSDLASGIYFLKTDRGLRTKLIVD